LSSGTAAAAASGDRAAERPSKTAVSRFSFLEIAYFFIIMYLLYHSSFYHKVKEK
jgi:hypothetical protein